MSLEVPVVLIIFRRPEPTRKVFAAIREAQPTCLYVLADGPRSGHANEVEKCVETRAIVEEVDWPCEVTRMYSDENLGLKKRISTGLNSVFESEERAIILEDDCVPIPSFFRFCAEMLDAYADVGHVMTVSGNNYQPTRRTRYSYYLSRYMHCWGWATWRSAWSHFDGDMHSWPRVQEDRWLEQIFGSSSAVQYWTSIFDRTHAGQINSWAYAWQYNIWMNAGLNILPESNLVRNVGFGEEATNTRGESGYSIPAEPLDEPFRHPPSLVRHREADWFTQHRHYQTPITEKIVRRISGLTSMFSP